jgi:hypothetical protein
MPTVEDPKFPRKLTTGGTAAARNLQAQLGNWRVDPICADLWHTNRAIRRNDTFIGLLDTATWVLYVAPCFGVTPEQARARGLVPAGTRIQSRGEAHRTLQEALSKYQIVPPALDPPPNLHLPRDLDLVIGSTSRERDAARTTTWRDVMPDYATGAAVHGNGACLVAFTDVPADRGFDGNSHQALECWVRNNIRPPVAPTFKRDALGFAIQRDALSYFVRFASSFNQEEWGATGSDVNVVFGTHAPAARDRGREIRDMPKEWAKHLVKVLARDLHLGYLEREKPGTFGGDERTNHPRDKPDKFFARIRSRGEADSTKVKRVFTAADTIADRPARGDRLQYQFTSFQDAEFRLT